MSQLKYADERTVLTHRAGEYAVLGKNSEKGFMRYAVCIRPNSPALKRIVCVNVRGCHAEVEGSLDMIEKVIMRSFMYDMTRRACDIKYIKPRV